MRLIIFPVSGAVLFPGLQLPLHVFEPRYRTMVSDALATDRLIGMIQPQRAEESAPLFSIGCIGRIEDVETLNDGRYNIVLDGQARFRLVRELDVSTPYRQIEAEQIEPLEDTALASVERAGLELEARRFAQTKGYSVDWESVSRLDDEALVNGVSQIAPFDPAAKQALLEANTLSERCELLIQIMQFFALRDAGDDRVTLQ